MKVALVQCPGWGRECPPHALAVLAAYVRRKGHEAFCFDLNNALYHASPSFRNMWEDKDQYSFWENPDLVGRLLAGGGEVVDRFVKAILETGAPVIGFSTHTTSFLASLEIARRIKSEDPGRIVIFGGPQCSREQAGLRLAEERHVDAVVVREGELTLADILDTVQTRGHLMPMPGIILRVKGSVRDCGDRELIEDINSLPYPDYSDFASDIIGRRYGDPSRLEIFDSRGCVRKCHFCSEWQFWRRFRQMTGKRMFDEVKHQIRLFPQVKMFYFIGSLLNGDMKALNEFCDLLIESGTGIHWMGQAIASPAMNNEMMQKMARAGCVWLGYGIESGSGALRSRVNKKFTNKQAYETLKATHDAGIQSQINIMFGLPTETREEFSQTLDFLRRVRPYVDTVLASQSFAVLDKGTAFYNNPEIFGIRGHEHHLYWESNNGENNYQERFRRYEEFCRLALSLGIPQTSGVLSVKPDKWLLLGNYYRHKKEYVKAIRCYRRSIRLENANATVLEAIRQSNIALNIKELSRRKTVLASTPRLVTLGAHNGCNARCIFCPPASYTKFNPELYRNFFETKTGRYIRQAEKVTFTGYGEVLLIPGIEDFLDYLNETIPETEKIFTTNGTPLRPRIIERMLKSRYVVQVSLHASSAPLHEKLTGLKDFQGIISGISTLTRQRKEFKLFGRLHIALVNTVTTENIDDLAGFIRLAWDLGVQEVMCNYMTMYNEDHIRLSCFFAQERTNSAICRAREALEKIKSQSEPGDFEHFHVGLPNLFSQQRAPHDPAPVGQQNRQLCADPWEHIYIESQGSVLPCCLWGAHVGNLGEGADAAGQELDDIWNGPFYRNLRQGMASENPHFWCSNCVKYRGFNVDSLLCHLTNRPNEQKILLKEIASRNLADVPAQVEEAASL